MRAPFTIVFPGADASVAPATPRNVPVSGGPASPTAEATRAQFQGAVVRVTVSRGETALVVDRARLHDIIQWLHDDPAQSYEYLSDLTAVEHRDTARPIEVVWHLRSLRFRRFLRVKVEIPNGAPLEVASVWDIYKGVDWLERECYDMFGIHFSGHPDLRRILLWEQYKEGFPLRKDFPLRGRFSRSEQLKNALAANPEARYSMEELSIANAYSELPAEMRQRLAKGEKTGE
ncbi:MAG: NADH-quinone oxidoreductase subunit C [Gemmatimonadaceae bacterium]|nr:NADH-quinone oxidoreductase subunit C [Gemmatimonadaceae bacterium]